MGKRISAKAIQKANRQYLDLSNILDHVGLLAQTLIISNHLYLVLSFQK